MKKKNTKCERCGKDTGTSWKRYCYLCWKEVQREKEDHAYLEAWKSGNLQTDLDYAEDSYYLD